MIISGFIQLSWWLTQRACRSFINLAKNGWCGSIWCQHWGAHSIYRTAIYLLTHWIVIWEHYIRIIQSWFPRGCSFVFSRCLPLISRCLPLFLLWCPSLGVLRLYLIFNFLILLLYLLFYQLIVPSPQRSVPMIWAWRLWSLSILLERLLAFGNKWITVRTPIQVRILVFKFIFNENIWSSLSRILKIWNPSRFLTVRDSNWRMLQRGINQFLVRSHIRRNIFFLFRCLSDRPSLRRVLHHAHSNIAISIHSCVVLLIQNISWCLLLDANFGRIL